MSQINHQKTTDENIVVRCPNCERENVFNRRANPELFTPVTSCEVECQYLDCRERFVIWGDLINPTHEMLLFEARRRMDSKKYRDCIEGTIQAIEVCIAFVLRIDILYRPFWREGGHNLGKLNELIKKLSKKLGHGFDKKRSCLLRYMLTGSRFETLDLAEDFITKIPKKPRIPGKARIRSISDIKLRLVAEKIRDTKIHEIRNKCTHEAFCPLPDDAQKTLEEAHEIVSKLKFYYNTPIDDINWYRRESIP